MDNLLRRHFLDPMYEEEEEARPEDEWQEEDWHMECKHFIAVRRCNPGGCEATKAIPLIVDAAAKSSVDTGVRAYGGIGRR